MSGTILPVVMTAAGAQPQSPASLQTQLLAAVAATNPGYTANLPGSLVDDISGTDVAAIALCDSFRVELINSLTPYGANQFLLNQQGQLFGVSQNQPTNTSVYVVFTGPNGFVIAQSFIVSDGSYQYTVTNGGVIGASGTSLPLYATATQTGSWAVLVNSVVQLVTSVLSGVSLTVTNPTQGTPGGAQESLADYRAAVLLSCQAVAVSMQSRLKTLLNNVPGVISRLVSTVQIGSGGWEIIVGGTGDSYQIAYAIYIAMGFNISTLIGSVMTVTGITNANPGVITTGLNHGYTTGQVVTMTGATGLTALNGVPLTITVVTETTFQTGVNTTSDGSYTGNGVLMPNFRNVSVNLTDYPDTYTIPFVVPPAQVVTMTITWNTTATNYLAAASVAAAVQPAMVNYINELPVGQPINLFELQATFQAATVSLIPQALLTRMVFSVAINGIGVSPESGTGIIAGDPESYFTAVASGITVNQG